MKWLLIIIGGYVLLSAARPTTGDGGPARSQQSAPVPVGTSAQTGDLWIPPDVTPSIGAKREPLIDALSIPLDRYHPIIPGGFESGNWSFTPGWFLQ